MEYPSLRSRLLWRSVEPAVFVKINPDDVDYLWFDVTPMVYQWGTREAEMFFKLTLTDVGFLAGRQHKLMQQHSEC